MKTDDALLLAIAHAVLNRVKDGQDVPIERIVWALRMTGDCT